MIPTREISVNIKSKMMEREIKPGNLERGRTKRKGQKTKASDQGTMREGKWHCKAKILEKGKKRTKTGKKKEASDTGCMPYCTVYTVHHHF